MASRRDGIIANRVTALTAGAPTGTTVHRFRTRPIEKDNLPAIVVYPLEETNTDLDHDNSSEHVLRWAAECRVKTADGESPDEAVDALYVHCIKKTIDDRTFGGLAADTVEVRTVWDAIEGDETYVASRVEFATEFHTEADDPEVGV